MTIPTVSLAGKQVGRVGLGLMQLTWSPTPPPEDQALAAMKAAADAGATSWSTATFYGNPGDGEFDNLRLIGRFFEKWPEYKGKVQVVVKGGIGAGLAPINDLAANRALLEKAKALLGVPIDIYLPARVLPTSDPVAYFAPFETLRQEGHFRALGACEVSATTLTALSAVYDIAFVEVEVSLWSWTQDVRDVIAWCTKSKVGVHCYSPLGKGFITRQYKAPEDVPDGSFQRYMPRFQGEAFYHNLKLVDALEELAGRRGWTVAQMAVAWVCSLSQYNIPIPGSSNPERVRENTEAANITLSAEDIDEINAILAQFEVRGGRYPDDHSSALMV